MILLTGATGFIGKHLLTKLQKEFGFDNVVALTSKPIANCKYLLHNNYNFDNDYFEKSGLERIETIIHAGAYTPKKGSEANNLEKCFSNVFSTLKLLQANLSFVKKIVFLSTLDVYKSEEIITEETSIEPTSLYGTSKFYCEKMVESWAKANNVCFQILRLGHVYGEGEEAYNKIIPVTMRKIIANKPVEVYGTGQDFRSFIYIEDAITAILNSLKLDEFKGVINLVSDSKIKIIDLVKKIIHISKKDVVINKILVNSVSRNLIFDNTKMKELLHNPKIKLEEGLRREWDYLSKE